jgi:hypothetical protein
MRSAPPTDVAVGTVMLDQIHGHAHRNKLWDEWISGKRVTMR